MADSYNLQRFIDAQSGVYEQVCAELRRGRKTSHWIWFIFPQVSGLGQSSMTVRYAIASLDEAQAYLEHPVLGPRLRECCGLLMPHRGKAIEQIMGYPDDLKLKSSMTLFAKAAEAGAGAVENAVFDEVLKAFYAGERDKHTIVLL